ncbi:MAG: LysM peptidoglycan-binding domain-containing protein [Planctomycetota bacterium]
MLSLIFLCLLGTSPAATTSHTIPDIIPEGHHSVPVDRTHDLSLLHEHCCVQYVIQKGDTFEKLARSKLGSAGRVHDITALNPDADPRRLKVGERIWLPPRDANAPHRFVYLNRWPGVYRSEPFALSDRVYGRYVGFAFVIVDEANRATVAKTKKWPEVLELEKAEKVQVIKGSTVRGLVADGSKARRITEKITAKRDAKGRYSLETVVEHLDADGKPIATAGNDKQTSDQMWLLLLTLGGAGLIWLRLRQRAPSSARLAVA